MSNTRENLNPSDPKPTVEDAVSGETEAPADFENDSQPGLAEEAKDSTLGEELQDLSQLFLSEPDSPNSENYEEAESTVDNEEDARELPPALATDAALFWIQSFRISKSIDKIRDVALAGGDWEDLFDGKLKNSYNGVKLGIHLAMMKITEEPGFRLANWKFVTAKLLQYAKTRREAILAELAQLNISKKEVAASASSSSSSSTSESSVSFFKLSDKLPKENDQPVEKTGPNLS